MHGSSPSAYALQAQAIVLCLSPNYALKGTLRTLREFPGYDVGAGPLNAALGAMVDVFPATQIRPLRWCIVLLCAGCAWQTWIDLTWVLQGEYVYGILALVWIAVGVGLWRLRAAARDVAQVLIWLVLLLAPLDSLNPFASMEEFGPDPGNLPSTLYVVLVYVLPWMIAGVCSLHVLGLYRQEFRQP